MSNKLARWLGLAAACAATLLAAPASADPYPQRPVSIIVPTTPGGTADILARLIGPRLSACRCWCSRARASMIPACRP